MPAPRRPGRGEPAGSPARVLPLPNAARARRPRLTRRAALAAVAALVLAVGYADLARGGITLSAILLVVGYTVLVPVAIVGGVRA